MKFPYIMKVVSYGETLDYSLEQGQRVKCLRCGKSFQINEFTAKKYNGFVTVTCPNVLFKNEETGEVKMCGYKADAFYYMKRRKKSEQMQSLRSKDNLGTDSAE